ncbi:Uncharacterized protein Fot_00968 [Forsythia ovata]|uniref:Uncharacterized protein n=1 Tax=Forsythia ovata TaxID=205694 RepID=A0ABD1X2P2_9LAMI
MQLQVWILHLSGKATTSQVVLYTLLCFLEKSIANNMKFMKPESLHLKEGLVDHAGSASILKLEESEVTQSCFRQLFPDGSSNLTHPPVKAKIITEIHLEAEKNLATAPQNLFKLYKINGQSSCGAVFARWLVSANIMMEGREWRLSWWWAAEMRKKLGRIEREDDANAASKQEDADKGGENSNKEIEDIEEQLHVQECEVTDEMDNEILQQNVGVSIEQEIPAEAESKVPQNDLLL